MFEVLRLHVGKGNDEKVIEPCSSITLRALIYTKDTAGVGRPGSTHHIALGHND